MKIAVLLFPGAEELDVFAPYEVLALAGGLGAGFSVELVSVEAPAPMTLSKGAMVIPHRQFSAGVDLLVVPGGGWANRAAIGVRSEVENPATLELIRSVFASGAVVASVCTGTLLLAKAGLLEGVPAITHQSAVEDLRAMGVPIQEARVVDTGRIVTSGGITSGLDLALWLIERFSGAELSGKVAEAIEYLPRNDVWQAESAG